MKKKVNKILELNNDSKVRLGSGDVSDIGNGILRVHYDKITGESSISHLVEGVFIPHYDKNTGKSINGNHRHLFKYTKDGKLIKPVYIDLLD